MAAKTRAVLFLAALFLSSCGGGSAPTSTMASGNGAGNQPPPPLTGLSMTTARAAHTATLLSDGRVLVAGGAVWEAGQGFSATASAELYDPSAGSFSRTGDMNTARSEHVAARLADGKVLVAGGVADFKNYANPVSAEIYDPATATFRATGSMVFSGRVASAVLLADGRVFIGQDGNSAEIYDPATEAFTVTGAYGNATVEIDTAVLLPSGMVLVVGCATNCSVGMTALFDPRTDQFSPTGSRQAWFAVSTGTVLTDGTVLFVEGNDSAWPDDVEIYDPTTGAFTYVGHTHDVHEFSTATRLPDGSVLIAGGQLVGGSGNPAVELYAPATRTFTPATRLTTGRHSHTATLLPDGSVLVAGGYSVWPFSISSAEVH